MSSVKEKLITLINDKLPSNSRLRAVALRQVLIKMILDGEFSDGGPIDIPIQYADIASLLSGQNQQSPGIIYYVEDASDDPTIDTGDAYYEKLNITTGQLIDYRRLTPEERELFENGILKIGSPDLELESVFKIVFGEGFTISPIVGGGTKIEYNPGIIPGGDKSFTYIQSIPENTWLINHQLNKRPSISIVDSSEESVEGLVTYIDNNNVRIDFIGAFSGKAYIN